MKSTDNCWQTLNIEPTQDLRAVKLAYAKLLKITRPDQDPQGFTRLHDAYKEAQWLAQSEWFWDEQQADGADIDADSDAELASTHNDAAQEISALERTAALDDVWAPLEMVHRAHPHTAQQPEFDDAREQRFIDEVLGAPLARQVLSPLTPDALSSSDALRIDADAARFFDSLLLPTDWLAQIETLLEAERTTLAQWQTVLDASVHFDIGVKERATHLILWRINAWYQEEWQQSWKDNVLNGVAYLKNIITEWRWPEGVLSLVAQKLEWWAAYPTVYPWQSEYDALLVEILWVGTTSNKQRKVHYRAEQLASIKQYFKPLFKKKHVGAQRQASFTRKFIGLSVDIMASYGVTLALASFFSVYLNHTFALALSIFLAIYILIGAELSPSRGFVGNRLMGLTLVDSRGGYLKIPQLLLYYVANVCALAFILSVFAVCLANWFISIWLWGSIADQILKFSSWVVSTTKVNTIIR
jgi:hypothetical protein